MEGALLQDGTRWPKQRDTIYFLREAAVLPPPAAPAVPERNFSSILAENASAVHLRLEAQRLARERLEEERLRLEEERLERLEEEERRRDEDPVWQERRRAAAEALAEGRAAAARADAAERRAETERLAEAERQRLERERLAEEGERLAEAGRHERRLAAAPTRGLWSAAAGIPAPAAAIGSYFQLPLDADRVAARREAGAARDVARLNEIREQSQISEHVFS